MFWFGVYLSIYDSNEKTIIYCIDLPSVLRIDCSFLLHMVLAYIHRRHRSRPLTRIDTHPLTSSPSHGTGEARAIDKQEIDFLER